MSSTRISVFLCAVGLTCGTVASTVSRSEKSGQILGRVVDGDSGRPVSEATVRLTWMPVVTDGIPAPQSFDDSVLTDGSGRFVFAGLPAGSFQLTVKKSGFVDGGFGKVRPTGGTINLILAPDERRIDVSLNIWRLAELSGDVIDDHGEPVVGVGLQVLERSTVSGRELFVTRGTTTTDDRGEFHAWNLPPGHYVLALPSVSVAVPAGFSVQDLTRTATSALGRQIPALIDLLGASDSLRTQGVGGFAVQVMGRGPTPPPLSQNQSYPTIFYPSSASPGFADEILLRSGETRGGLQLRLTLSHAVQIAGTVTNDDGPMSDVVVRLLPSTAAELMSDIGFETAVSLTDKAGRFLFVGVPEGRYTVRVMHRTSRNVAGTQPGVATVPIFTLKWIQQDLLVNGTNMPSLELRLRDGLNVGGMVSFLDADRTTARAKTAAIGLVLEPADGRPRDLPVVQPNPDGRFDFSGIEPGRYFLRVRTSAPGWMLHHAVYQGVDISDESIQIEQQSLDDVAVTFTNHPSELSGTVYRAGRLADSAATVAVFPVDPRYWSDFGWAPRRLRTVRTTEAGRFEVLGLPAGKYRIAAYADAAGNDWANLTDMIQGLSRIAETVDVKDGERTSIDLMTTLGAKR